MLAKWQKLGLATVVSCGVMLGVTQVQGTGLTSWKSGLNHDRIIQIQNEGGTREAADGVEIAYFSNSSFQVTSPRGISIIVDPWRNDPSGAWGLWYHVEYPAAEVDIGMSTHAHFDHDALDKIDANMLLDRMGGSFELGDVKITGIADKHQCVAPGLVPWTEAVKQFEGRDDPCVDNFRHMDNTNAKIAIPHHYLVPETTYYTSTLLPATEWAETHEHTMLDSASVMVTKADLEGKQGHVYYFGSHNMVSAEAEK